ncbi:hypothetical protein ICW40_07635 [Actinotalea ferrariae]|uniref:DUF6498-containing protein n=1 Tax=Actinotalea ferrariae TaxID=1386098 RepID=UPI001C8CE1E1|nr:DUF6498-containing protein [Actinotalea ferrariae]MBX9244680.1 hypothetical protein [Actinotalea ferrariae]
MWFRIVLILAAIVVGVFSAVEGRGPVALAMVLVVAGQVVAEVSSRRRARREAEERTRR